MPKEVYKQKFRESWLLEPNLKNWICRDPRDPDKAYCKYCKCSLNAKIDQLRAHGTTKKHIQNAAPYAQVNKITFKTDSTPATRRQEAALAMFCAQHTAINPVGHMSELCSLHFGAKDIKLQRTKCTSIIKYVLAPHFDEELRKDIGDSKFSLLIDESTDISINKVLGVAIVFYSNQRLDITSTLLSLIQIESGDAVTIANCVLAELNKRKIPIKNMVGIGTDNANVMDPLKIPRVCDTRWLSIEHAVKRILDQWIELKLHFNTTALNEKCHKASILSDLYSEVNYLYLLFLKPILEVMQRINKNFQSNTSNPTKLLAHYSIKTKIAG
ncbi:hypothetical protein ACLKA6_002064 [Drosophila palustris]